MNVVDILLLLPLLYGCIQGFRHGVVSEIGSFLSIIIGIYVARFWAPDLSVLIVNWFDCQQQIAIVVAYIVAFIIGALGIRLLAYLISKLLDIVKIGWINKLIGAAFGTFKWLLILSLVLNLLSMINSYAPIIQTNTIQQSKLYRPIENTLKNTLPFLNFEKLQEVTHKLSE